MAMLSFEYEFDLGDQEVISHEVRIDEETLSVHPQNFEGAPDWARLEFNKCDNCPLSPEKNEFCPIAAGISQVVEKFDSRVSYEMATVRVTAPERTYTNVVPLQYGLFSLMGLIMATSNCPHMGFLKPMARFHLPFASATETIVRSVSMFLLRRYFENKDGGEKGFSLSDLDDAYVEINEVNKGIVRRIGGVTAGDADANAVIILHAIATSMSQSLASDLEDVERLFQ